MRATAAGDGEADFAAWPVSAQLESYPGTARFNALDYAGDTVDAVRAGAW